MIRSQIVVLNVIYSEDEDSPRKDTPAEWNWSDLVDEPIPDCVEVLAAGPPKEHPDDGDDEEETTDLWRKLP